MSVASPTHVAALERLQKGDETVISALIEEYAPKLGAVIAATWHGIAEADVEEIVAETFADAWFHANDVSPARGGIEAWLIMRCRYRTLDRLRAARRHRSLLQRLRVGQRGSATEVEYASDLDAYLADLSDVDRRLAMARFVEQRTIADSAERCGLTPKAAEHRLGRLRKRLLEKHAAIADLEVAPDG